MLKYELLEDNLNYATYKYCPENKEEAGFIVVSKINKEILRLDVAPDDEFKWYALKLYKRIQEWIDKGNLPQTGKIAWY